jgi:DNA repair exonuclease SbcCD ATPase subunit
MDTQDGRDSTKKRRRIPFNGDETGPAPIQLDNAVNHAHAIEMLEAKNGELLAVNTELSVENAQYQSDYTQMQTTATQAHSDLSVSKAENAAISENLATERARVFDLGRELVNGKSERDQLVTERNQLVTENQGLRQKNAQQVWNNQRILDQRKSELKQLQNAHTGALSEITAMKAAVTQAHSDLSTSNNNNMAISEQLAHAKTAIDKQNKPLNVATQKNLALTLKNASLLKKVEDIRLKHTRCQVDLSSLTNTHTIAATKAQSDIASSKAENDKISAELGTVVTEISKLRAELEILKGVSVGDDTAVSRLRTAWTTAGLVTPDDTIVNFPTTESIIDALQELKKSIPSL